MTQSKSNLFKPGAALLLLSLAAACSSSGDGKKKGPKVLSNSPLDQAVAVPVNASSSAIFSQQMDPATINAITFTLTDGAIPVQGTVLYSDSNSQAMFWPTAHLADNTLYTATITTGAQNLSGVGLKADHVWTYTTSNVAAPASAVDLGQAGNFVILAKSGISTVPTSNITGNLGISPAAASSITGFALTLDGSGQFSTSTQVTGMVHAADYAAPTPANLTTAVSDMETAFTEAAARTSDVTELGAGNIGGLTLAPGVYKWSTSLTIPTDVTLNGNATDVWILQIAQDLTMSSATSVLLTGGALPENVFWQVTGLVDLGTTADFSGIILCATAITLQTGASVSGRLLAQTAVNLDMNTVAEP